MNQIEIVKVIITGIVKDYMIKEDMMNNINNNTVIIFIIYKECSFKKELIMFIKSI